MTSKTSWLQPAPVREAWLAEALYPGVSLDRETNQSKFDDFEFVKISLEQMRDAVADMQACADVAGSIDQLQAFCRNAKLIALQLRDMDDADADGKTAVGEIASEYAVEAFAALQATCRAAQMSDEFQRAADDALSILESDWSPFNGRARA